MKCIAECWAILRLLIQAKLWFIYPVILREGGGGGGAERGRRTCNSGRMRGRGGQAGLVLEEVAKLVWHHAGSRLPSSSLESCVGTRESLACGNIESAVKHHWAAIVSAKIPGRLAPMVAIAGVSTPMHVFHMQLADIFLHVHADVCVTAGCRRRKSPPKPSILELAKNLSDHRSTGTALISRLIAYHSP